ncbi:MAG: hypothetical protein ABIR55_10600 [Burkholderiaceae bacterium]
MNDHTIPTHAPNIIDHVADSTSQAIQSTQKATNQALGGLDNSVQSLRDHAAPKLDEMTQRASDFAHQSVQSVRDTGRRLRESAVEVSEGTVQYVRDEPIKSMLIAAATGAMLMALVTLLARDKGR